MRHLDDKMSQLGQVAPALHSPLGTNCLNHNSAEPCKPANLTRSAAFGTMPILVILKFRVEARPPRVTKSKARRLNDISPKGSVAEVGTKLRKACRLVVAAKSLQLSSPCAVERYEEPAFISIKSRLTSVYSLAFFIYSGFVGLCILQQVKDLSSKS